MVYKNWVILVLIICTITDLKERKIYSKYCFINIACALAVHIYNRDMFWGYLVGGVALGIVFVIVSIVSKEALGMGDAFMILTLGSIIGIKENFEILLWSFIICGVVSIIEVLLRKRKLNSKIPFAPYLLAGSIAGLVMEVMC